MHKCRLNQLQFARVAAVTQGAVCRHFTGLRTSLSASTALRIARATGCDLGWLISGFPIHLHTDTGAIPLR